MAVHLILQIGYFKAKRQFFIYAREVVTGDLEYILRRYFPARDIAETKAPSKPTRLEQQQVRQALDRLTDLQRQAVELAYYQGYTYAECATVLDANPSTVKTRMRDGLVRLRDCLGVEAAS